MDSRLLPYPQRSAPIVFNSLKQILTSFLHRLLPAPERFNGPFHHSARPSLSRGEAFTKAGAVPGSPWVRPAPALPQLQSRGDAGSHRVRPCRTTFPILPPKPTLREPDTLTDRHSRARPAADACVTRRLREAMPAQPLPAPAKELPAQRPLGAKRTQGPRDRRPRAHAPRRPSTGVGRGIGGNSPSARRACAVAASPRRRACAGAAQPGAEERGVAIAILARPGRHPAYLRCVGFEPAGRLEVRRSFRPGRSSCRGTSRGVRGSPGEWRGRAG